MLFMNNLRFMIDIEIAINLLSFESLNRLEALTIQKIKM